MSLERLTAILQHASLDRETKLQIIDLLSYSNNEWFLEELIDLVLEWDQAQTQSLQELTEQIKTIKDKYASMETSMENNNKRKRISIADEFITAEKIETLRERILNSL